MTQQEALDLLKLGGNTFLTGAAGSGKTYLLNQYIDHLRTHGVNMAITASTGIAATHIGGQTIHSWSGIGINDYLSDEDIQKIVTNKRLKANFNKTKVLIIDEVSMLHARQLDMVERISRAMLDEEQSFGGLQVILCGDFFQLPPITKSSYGFGGNEEYEKKFAYECPAWEQGNFNICYLHEQFRQKNTKKGSSDPLLSILNDIRNGEASEKTKIPLRTRYKKDPETEEDISPTKLFSRNVNVDSINQRELKKIQKQSKIFTMETHGFKKLVETLQRSCLSPEELELKTGAEVMFVKNSNEGKYVNGTRGVIESFDQDSGYPVVRTFDGLYITATPEEWRLEEDGAVRATIKQVPLRLAWAITIHKSQGMTLDAAEIDLSDAFEPGMGYVALSRVRSLDGLKLLGLNDTALRVHPTVLEHDKKFQEWSDLACTALKEFPTTKKQTKQEEILFERFCGLRDTKLVQKRQENKIKKKKTPTHLITAEMLAEKKSLEDIANERELTLGTVISHVEKLSGSKMLPDMDYVKKKIKSFASIKKEFSKSNDGALTPVFKKFKGKYSFETLRLVRALM